jgi:phosphoglycolate phosphatase
MVGEGTKRLIEKVLGEENIHAKAAVIKTFLEYYSAHLTDYSRVYPHVKETLEILSGVRKAVISNKREDLSRNLLNKLDLLKYFEIVAGGDTTVEKKPSAMPIMYILDKLRVEQQEAIMVGDSNFDIEAGKKAGVKTVAVTYGFRERKYLADADYMIDSMKDILSILDIDYSKFI